VSDAVGDDVDEGVDDFADGASDDEGDDSELGLRPNLGRSAGTASSLR
jgi:hypothetical protein